MTLNSMPGHLIRRLHQISTQIFQQHIQEAGIDMTSVQFATLHALNENPGIEQSQIAAKISYDKATIGGVIDRLEKRGYVIRETSQKDRRARQVRLSDSGKKIFLKARPLVEELQQEIISGLDRQEQKLLVSLLRKVVIKNEN